MKFELKDFQAQSARSLLAELEKSRLAVRLGKPQALLLSAPAGAGKTTTVAALVEWTLGGAPGLAARPATTFLWLTDAAQLNQHARGKLRAACDKLPFHKLVTVDGESFDEERLAPGNVFFVSTHQLEQDSLLTTRGNKKKFTFWQSVANTIAQAPEDFVLVLDETRRDPGVQEAARKAVTHKLLAGSPEDGLAPVPLVLGMSSTPQRLTELLGSSARTLRPVHISPDRVRQSGLLKDTLVLHLSPQATPEGELALLKSAAVRWRQVQQRWSDYCMREHEKEVVKPVLFVQVQEGSGSMLSATPLDAVVAVLEREMGPLSADDIRHCFTGTQDIEQGGRIIRHMDAAAINHAPDVKVVLFKTALTSDWVCPRAEVMVSFRSASDIAGITQLARVMIRAPLTRRIESDETLNEVALYLTSCDARSRDLLLQALRHPQPHEGLPISATTRAFEYTRHPEFAEAFDRLSQLQTYSVDAAPSLSHLERLLRLSGGLLHEGYAVSVKDWAQLVSADAQMKVSLESASMGAMSLTVPMTSRLQLSADNIDQLFEQAGHMLAAGEGLHRSYIESLPPGQSPARAKLSLIAVVQQAATLPALQQLAAAEFQKLWSEHQSEISQMPAAVRGRFLQLLKAGGVPALHAWALPERIVEKPAEHLWTHHLYANSDGEFAVDLDGWEDSFIGFIKSQKSLSGWLRNLAYRDWAFCIPYEMSAEHPFYPDFIILRKSDQDYVVDILERCDESRPLSWAKTRGLARFAQDHAHAFGRLMVGRKLGSTLQTLDLADPQTRALAMQISKPADLQALFDAH
jgi:type III restriction enzyme